MSSNFINNLKGLVDFSGANPHLLATSADIEKVTTPQYSMATPEDVAALTKGNLYEMITPEQAVKELSKPVKGQGKFTVTSGANKVIETTKNINNLFNNPVGGAAEKASQSKLLQLLKTAARPTSKMGVRALGPAGAILGAGATIKDVYDLGKAIVNNINVNKDFDQAAYDEAQLRQMRRAEGASNAEIDAELEQLKAQKAASDAEVARQQALTDNAKASYEAALAAQQQPASAGGMVPPATQAAGGGEGEPSGLMANMQLPKTTLDYTNLNGIGDYSLPMGQSITGGAAGMEYNPLAEKFTQDILGNNGGISQEQIMQQLQDNMSRVREVQARDPRYQGEILTPDNPYQVDTQKLQNLQDASAYINRMRDLAGLPQMSNWGAPIQENATRLYQQQLANQAGVPYEDYIAATMEARSNEINNLAAEREAILKQQAMQATNMKEKIGYMQKLRELESERIKALQEVALKGRYDLEKQGLSNLGSLQVAQTNVGGDLAVERLRQQDPTRLMGGAASLYEAMAFTPEMYRGQAIYNLPAPVKEALGIQALTPEELAQLFAGRANQMMQPQQRPTFTQRWDEWVQNRRGQ